MPTINQLPTLSQVSGGDQLPVYVPNNGDARRVSINQLLQYFQQTFASPTLSTNLYVPGNGFNITVPTPVSDQQWMLLQPAGTLATGTITLPLNTGVPDGTTVLITTTQEITSLTLALNGASAIFGGVTSLAAGTATVIRFYQPTNSWYQINAETVYAAGIQTFLAVPSSANLRAALTDETGTGSAVFATGPTFNNINGSVQALSGAGAVNLTTYSTAFTSTAAGNALTLADGAQGQIKNIVYVAEAAGGDTGVLTPTNLGAGTTITFNAVGDSCQLQFIGTDWWSVSLRGAVLA